MMPAGQPSNSLDRIDLDAASQVPLRLSAKQAMTKALNLPAADPGRNHTEGRIVRDALEQAREAVAQSIGLQSSRITFTSGTAESVATVLASVTSKRPGTVLLSAVEREAFHLSAATFGGVETLEVSAEGLVDLNAVAVALALQPAVVCCQWANQETGTIQPIADLVEMAKAANVPIVVDATQAGRLEPGPWVSSAFVLISSEGLGGPAGIGALSVPKGTVLRPLLLGGAQERGRRAGLEATVLAVGFGAAAEENAQLRSTEAPRLRRILDALVSQATALPGVRRVGPNSAQLRLPDCTSLEVDGVGSEAVVVGLDRRGVAAHSGAACASETFEPSPVLAAMGSDAEHALRLSVSWATPIEVVDAFGERFVATIEELRQLAT